MAVVSTDGTAQGATVEQTADTFLSMLSGSSEDRKERETPPTQNPASEQPESEAAEPAGDEGESQQSEQETEQEQPETPESSALDPSMKVRTKIDGQEVEVTLEEALKGYSRTQDYTRKTQELSERRKAFESEETAVRGERAKVAEYLKNLEQVIAEVTPKEPNWEELRQTDPTLFAQKWAEWDQHKKEVEAVKTARAEAEQRVAQDYAAQYQRHLEAEKVKLHEAIPEWKNAEVAKTEKAKMVEYANKLGFDNERLAQVDDHRVLTMLRKAMLYDAAQATKPEIKARIEKVKTATPGGAAAVRPPVTDQTRALQRLAKTGKVDDASAAFLSMLQGK
jgi:hypothetical protein